MGAIWRRRSIVSWRRDAKEGLPQQLPSNPSQALDNGRRNTKKVNAFCTGANFAQGLPCVAWPLTGLWPVRLCDVNPVFMVVLRLVFGVEDNGQQQKEKATWVKKQITNEALFRADVTEYGTTDPDCCGAGSFWWRTSWISLAKGNAVQLQTMVQ